MSKEIFFVGSYMESKEKEGIYVYSLDNQRGTLEKLSSSNHCVDPTYLAFRNDVLYAANERVDKGIITSYKFEKNELTYMNEIETPGRGLCYVSLWNQEPYIAASAYSTGHFINCKINDDLIIGECIDYKVNTGKGFIPKRQDRPHGHSLTPDPFNEYFVGADLGLDKIFIYKQTNGIMKLKYEVSVKEGKGPRHFAFNKKGTKGYLVTEMGNSVLVYDIDRDSGAFVLIQEIATIPENYGEVSDAAHIVISEDENYLYVSNRGHDSIACFSIEKKTGKLGLIDYYFSGGHYPRHFALSHKEDFMVIANQKEHNIVVFKRNKETGALLEKVGEERIFKPVCICFKQ